MPVSIVSIPEFRERYDQELTDGLEDPKCIATKMMKENWLTDELLTEVNSLLPDHHEKDGDGRRCPDAYKRKIGLLFPPGRVFASVTQFVQTSKMFLDAWAIQQVHGSSKISCHYGKIVGQKRTLHGDASKQRRQKVSVKELNCPFFISYALMNVIKHEKKPNTFYQMRIVSVSYDHNCCMSTTSHRVALRQSGQGQPNLEGMNTVLSLLKEQPGLPNTLLRPLLQKYLPHYKGMDSSFLRNFRNKAIKFICLNPNCELTLQDAQAVASQSFTASEEVIDLDQPILLQNFTSLLRKCMQQSSSIWIANRYLSETKVRIPGFDFRIHLDKDGCPDAVVWMTPDMRMNLLQYGNILFLDAQKRQFNRSNWPYIGPAMKDCEMKVCLAAECLCIQESLEMYIWILQMLEAMEPRYQLSQTSILFADELITPTVLVKLGIQDTCTLRGDQYHLLNEVWPKAFGTYCPQMCCHLEAMFTSKTIEAYEIGYNGASKVIEDDPAMVSKLDDFYNQPERYGGYYLHEMEENLGLKGDVSAEQNHSSICAHLGEGASWQIAEQVSKLLRRQQEQGKQRNEKEALENARTHRFTSRLKHQFGTDDVLAKKSLSMKAYKRFIHSTLKPSTSLQTSTDEDGFISVWPAGHLDTENYHKVVIQKDQRCPCSFRVQWNAICKHEYKVDGKLTLSKLAPRWLNRTTFESLVLPGLSSVENLANNGDSASNNNGGDGWHDMGVGIPHQSDAPINGPEVMDVDNLIVGDEFPIDVDDEDINTNKDGRLTYQSVKANCDEMCRYVQNDQLQLAELKLLTDRVLNRLRNRQNIHASFVDMNTDTPGFIVGLPKSAVGKVVPNSSGMKRMKSRFELGRSNRKNKATKANPSILSTIATAFDGSDENHLPPPKLDHRACSFCKQAHHFVGKCPVLHKHGVPPLAPKDTSARNRLQADLTSPGRIVTFTREETDLRHLYSTLP